MIYKQKLKVNMPKNYFFAVGLCLSLMFFNTSSSIGQISFEYFSFFSKFSDQKAPEFAPKIGHNFSVSYSVNNKKYSPNFRIGISNFGYKYDEASNTEIDSTSGTGFDLTYFNSTNTVNYNSIDISVGTKFRKGLYYVAPEVGIGFFLNSVTKTTRTYDSGRKATSRNRDDSNQFRLNFFPVNLSIGRVFELYDIDIHIGIRGNMIFIREGNKLSKTKAYGIGLFSGITF